MSNTQALLARIAALRQRLEQSRGPGAEAGAEGKTGKAAEGAKAPDMGITAVPGEDGARLEVLRRRTEAGGEHDRLVEAALRTLSPDGPAEAAVLPSQLTARARRVVQRGRELLAVLRPLAEEIEAEAGEAGEAGEDAGLDRTDGVLRYYRDTAAMTDSTLRMVQAFPDSPSAQLRLCEGLEAVLQVVGHRVSVLAALAARRRETRRQVDLLADWLTALAAGSDLTLTPLVTLAEAIVTAADEGEPLRLWHEPAGRPARFAAAHAWNTAQVMARVVRQDPDLRARPVEPVLAALIHDVGLVNVPGEVLASAGPLDDAGRRAVEAHVRVGADMVRRLLPDAGWLAEAIAGHHERMDGTGYPDGLRGINLSPLARLLAVCDVYTALSSPRPHRPARDSRTALTDTLLLAEGGALDSQQAQKLLALTFYPDGTAVELADGSLGVVVATHPASRPRRDAGQPLRPVVALVSDAEGRALPAPRYLDLARAEGRGIVRGLSAGERRRVLGGRYPEWA